ncbi:diguanylate cyclase [Mycetocola zhujimingii]|uniref:diguanylate cyclase n=1 Tax=Mycetocola zhujimingii TaxID=2079792 RepID=UPI001304B137|nr:diguanylate cyclase [Mycetocola zhujimingii]
MTITGDDAPNQALTASQLDFEELFEHAPCGYLVTDADGTITAANTTFLRMVGLTPADVTGRSFQSLLTVGSRLFHETRYLPVLRLRGRVDEIALSLLCADGSTLPTLVNGVQADESGEVRIAVFDSTERRDYERELLTARRAAEASEAWIRVLQSASSAFTIAETEEALAEALAESAREAFTATHTAVLFADQSGTLSVAAGTHPLRHLMHVPGMPEQRAMELGRVVTVSTSEEEDLRSEETASVLRSARLETVSAVPLMEAGRPIGAVVCFFGRRRDIDDEAVELFTTLARQAAHVLGRIRLQAQLARMALCDQLTGLGNRKVLQVRLTQALATATRSGRPLAVVFLDLDGFKVVNDNCGHAIGDEVLRQIGERLKTSVRTNDTIARYGGDEFVIVCEDTDADAVGHVTDRIRAAVKEPLIDVPDEFPVSASVGVALLAPDAQSEVTTDGILKLADAAMYQSKNAGKDRVTVVTV